MLNPPLLRPIAWPPPCFLGRRHCADGRARWVLSIMAYSLSASAARSLNIRRHTPLLGPSAEPGVNRLPTAEALRQVAPWNAGAIAVDHGIDKEPMSLAVTPT